MTHISSKNQATKPSPGSSAKSKAPFYLILSGLLLVFFITYGYVFAPKLDLNGDNFSYLLLGKSIGQGAGYTNLYSPGQFPASHFPPGYPAILGLFMMLKINNIIFFEILNGLFFLSAVCLLHLPDEGNHR